MSLDRMSSLLSSNDVEGSVEELCAVLKLPRYPSKESAKVRVDFLFSCVAIAVDKLSLTESKLSTFLKICEDTYDNLCGTNGPAEDVEEAFEGFRQRMVEAVAGDTSGTDQENLTLKEVRLLSKQITHSLFRFHKAYKLCASESFQQSLQVAMDAKSLQVQLPLQPTPLHHFCEEGLLTDDRPDANPDELQEGGESQEAPVA